MQDGNELEVRGLTANPIQLTVPVADPSDARSKCTGQPDPRNQVRPRARATVKTRVAARVKIRIGVRVRGKVKPYLTVVAPVPSLSLAGPSQPDEGAGQSRARMCGDARVPVLGDTGRCREIGIYREI
jgi:hypothetical protein